MENFKDDGMSNLFGGFPLFPDREGYLTLKMPLWGGKEDFPWISVTDDFGDMVHGVLLNPLHWKRRVVQATSAVLSPLEVVNTFISGICSAVEQISRIRPFNFPPVTGCRARFVLLTDPNQLETNGISWREQERDIFFFSQVREGEYFCNGPTETETAATLNRAAFKAKGSRGREGLMTVREYFEREFSGEPVGSI
jgi:hypothetical protein